MIYLLHIPKTGGCSLAAMLMDFAVQTSKRILGPCIVDDLVVSGADSWTTTDILCGHLGTLPLERVPNVKVITMLRHPATHLYSWYRHVRRAPDHYLHDAVISQNISFSDWLDWPAARMLVNNPQARYLGTHALMKGQTRRGETSRHEAWELGQPALASDKLTSAARHTLDQAWAVGCLEQLEDFQRHVAGLLGFVPSNIFRENVNPHTGADVPSEMVARITEDLCPIDMALYNHGGFERLPVGDTARPWSYNEPQRMTASR